MPDGAAAAAWHVRFPTGRGAKLQVMLQQLVASARFQSDVLAKKRLTVDDSSTGIALAIHCMVSDAGLIVLACTEADYPTRIVFGNGLLSRVASVADGMLGVDAFVAAGRGAPGSVRRVNLGDRATAELERVCADFEDKGGHDSLVRVQNQVDEVQGLMHGTLDTMLQNQEQLTSLRGKTEAIAGASKGFYREARTTRQSLECDEVRMKLVLAGVGVLFFLWLFRGWIFGGDEEEEGLLPPPSPPA